MDIDLITDEAACKLHLQHLERKKLLMSPKMKAYRDELMRSTIAKGYETTRSKSGTFELKGCVDIWEEKEMRADCFAADGTNQINQDYWDWKQKDLDLRGLSGKWLNR
jgi:hypothetical protein